MINLDSLSFYYPHSDKPALDNISLNINSGEMVAVVGANGSGKSTFAKIIAGLTNPTRGIVRTSQGAENNSIGFLFQNPDNQLIAMTVEKELVFNLENKGVAQTEMEKQLCKTLEDFKISHLRKRLTSELSGGEKQKVALASVMIDEPDILILDEPDSYLDRSGIELLMSEIKRLKEKNKNLIVIHITQYLSLAIQYKRLLIFDNGKIETDTTSDFESHFSKISTSNIVNAPDYMTQSENFDNITKISQIDLKNISFSYDDNKRIIDNLSALFSRGEITGIVGDSGSGKSSLGLLLAQFLKPDSGQLLYLDNRGEKISENQIGRIAFAFQFPEKQFFLNTVSEEISFGPKNFGYNFTSSDIRETLKLVGLEPDKFYKRDPFTLSGGEQRRLAIAVLIALKADFMILDEPTCGLDLNGVEQVKKILLALRDLGFGMIIISHDGNLINSLSDKLIYLNKEYGYAIYNKSDIQNLKSELKSLIY